MKTCFRILFLFLAMLFFLTALTLTAQEPSITLNGTSYTMQPHPRVWLNSTLASRSAGVPGTPAPKAVGTNPTWVALGNKAADFYSTYGDPSVNHNHDTLYQDGTLVALYASYWYGDNSQTTYLNAAEYLLNNITQYVPMLCNEAVKDCVNGTNGFYAGSYGPNGWMPNWIFAYEMIRSQMTTTQRQTLADKIFNDQSAWGGIGGSPSTTCTNRTNVGSTSVTVSSSGGVITASAPLFGSGHLIQVGDWVSESNDDVFNVIASITDSTHATLETDYNSQWNSYSGTLLSLSTPWQAGDCGWFWIIKHDWFTPIAIIGSAIYPSPQSGGETGGIDGDGTDNLTLQATGGMQEALLSLADDDVNFSSRMSPSETALYDGWYTTAFQGLNEYTYTGFTPTGSVYQTWEGYTVYPYTAFTLMNSVVSPPPLLNGIWAKNFLHHFYMGMFPSCPAQEPEYAQSFSPDSSYNSYMPWVTGIPGLVNMYNTDPEGKRLNYWMQNLWSTCVSWSGDVPGTNLMWSSSGLDTHGLANAVQYYWYIYWDPLFATDSALPTGSVDNFSDAQSATSGIPMAGAMSRTGYSSITDTLVNFYALATQTEDHTIPEDGVFAPSDYRIFKGGWLLGDDWSTYNDGGIKSMAPSIGSDSNYSGNIPWIDKMPLGHADANYMYAMTDSTQSYLSGANATGVYRQLIHFKKASTQDFVVVYDHITTSVANQKQIYLHYAQKTTAALSGTSVSESFPGTGNSDATQLLTAILAPAGVSSIHALVNNTNGTYTGGSGDTYRVTVCSSTTGTSCAATLTTAEFAVVHEPVAGTGNTMPTTSILATIDGNHRGIEIDGSSPKVAVFSKGGSSYTSSSFTTAHPGTAQYVVTGLTPGTYNVTVNGTPVVSGVTVSSGDESLYFESTSGAVVVSAASGPTYTLSISTTGTGSGTITGCAGTYSAGDPYSCSISPASGSYLAGFPTGCSGSGTTTYAGNMPASNCTVSATFNLQTGSTWVFGANPWTGITIK